MGGNAFEFAVELSDEVVERARQHESSFLARLFGPKPENDSDRINFLLKRLWARLAADWFSFLHEAMPQPWVATELVNDYVKGIVLKPPCLKMLLDDGEPGPTRRGRVHFRFSGCAGVAQVSANVCTHWVEIWFERNRDRIVSEFLKPNGIRLRAADADTTGYQWRFLPANDYGYAEHFPDAEECIEEGEPVYHFGLDAWSTEVYEETAGKALQFLEDRFASLMTDGRCRCQLCEPDFDLSQLQGLPM